MSIPPGGTPLKIALITSSYPPNAGGVEEHVSNVARGLRRRGHDVVVWTVAGERWGTRSVDGVVVRDLPCPLPSRSARGVLGFAARFPRAALTWWQALRHDRPDVLHVHCFGPNGTYARWLNRVVRRPLVLSAHGETRADADGVFESSALVRWSLRAGLGEADAVTGCSRMVLDDLVERFGLQPDSGMVVFNGIDPAERRGDSSPPVDGRYVLAVGRVVRVKGFDLLVEAFAGADLPSDVRLVIGGDGPELEALRRQAHSIGLGDRAVFPGRLSRSEVVAAMAGATLVVAPSRVEAFGIIVLEGWRAGVPVLATTRGGPPEFVREGVDGLLVDPEDVDALAERLRWVFDHPAEAAAIGRAGRSSSAAYTWERVVDDYERLYRSVGARD